MKHNSAKKLDVIEHNIIKAKRGDLKNIRQLLVDNRPYINLQTINELEKLLSHYWVVKNQYDQLSSAVALNPIKHPFLGQLLEIRGLVVDKSFRGKGIARDLMNSILEYVSRESHVVCITRSKRFFEKLGFVECHPFWITQGHRQISMDQKLDNTVPLFGERVSMIKTF